MISIHSVLQDNAGKNMQMVQQQHIKLWSYENVYRPQLSIIQFCELFVIAE